METIKLNLKVNIIWSNRYSATMEDDKQGRWARVAYAGTKRNFGTIGKKVALWDIAWIKKCEDKFTVYNHFPIVTTGVFDTVDQAKAAVEKDFRWFIQCCINS